MAKPGIDLTGYTQPQLAAASIDDAPGRSGTIHILAKPASHIALRHAPVPSAALGELRTV